MSDESALSSTPSEECIIEKFVSQFHDDYTNAVDEVRKPYFICRESTSVKKTNRTSHFHQLAYAQESYGSIYYTNDRDAALEATRKCIDALASWREQGKGKKEREGLYDAMKPRIRELQRQCEALPILSRYSHDA